MSQNPLDISALLGSRICHDLVNPIGAIGNGIELLEMTSSEKSPELDLVSESVVNANTRIKFFRIAYGATGQNQIVAGTELASILAELEKMGKIRYAWHNPKDCDRATAKLVFLTLQCGETFLPLGGEIEILGMDKEFQFVLSGPKVGEDTSLWDFAKGALIAPALAPNTVQFALLRQELKQQDTKLSYSRNDQKLDIRLSV